MCLRLPLVVPLSASSDSRAACWVGLALVLWGGGPGAAAGQALFFEGGPPVLRIDRFVPGRTTATATDASTTLVYARASGADRTRKVTVTARSAPRRFSLSVAPESPTQGTSLGPIALRSNRPRDLLRNIPSCPPPAEAACEGRTTLRYRLRADIDDPPGRAVYTVQYTLLAQ